MLDLNYRVDQSGSSSAKKSAAPAPQHCRKLRHEPYLDTVPTVFITGCFKSMDR